MPCYSPIYAVQVNEGDKIKFIKSSVMSIDELNAYKKQCEDYGSRFLTVPCGKCIGCRLEQSKQWAIRCALEARSYSDNYFLTLTYEDPPINISVNCDSLTGEFVSEDVTGYTLRKKDLQDFMKRLRIWYSRHKQHANIRFFGCGEYGSTTNRPHYHLCLFNLPIDDLIFYGNSKAGFDLFVSPTIQDIWKHGLVFISRFSYKTAAYVSRYVMKKASDDPSVYSDLFDLEPEFRLMSRRPGLGYDYFVSHSDRIYEFDEVNIQNEGSKPLISAPPRYFDYLAEKEFPELLSEIKAQRSAKADLLHDVELMATDLNLAQYNKVKEYNKQYSLSKLKRGFD